MGCHKNFVVPLWRLGLGSIPLAEKVSMAGTMNQSSLLFGKVRTHQNPCPAAGVII